MGSDFHTLAAAGIRVTLDLRVGHIRELVIERGGKSVAPLHTAPWVEDAATTGDATIAPSLRLLSGDFFCAPFGASDIEGNDAHGWTANSRWQLVEEVKLPNGASARYRLEHKVFGATVEKTFTLRDHHPFLYEQHTFIGGEGALPVANHAMVRLPHGGRLSFSPKRWIETPTGAPEPDPARGRSRLAYPARSTDLTHLPMADGSMADITRYPFAERQEDIALLIEDPANPLGWAAAQKNDSGELFLTLKNPADYPVTVLWFSNGGRDYAPWNSRHIGVLGIEEGRTTLYGHKASIEPNALTAAGVPTALTLVPNGRAEVRNVIGGLPGGTGVGVADVQPERGQLVIRFADGRHAEVPFDSAFLPRS
ncbi:MAG: hypothetical protein P4M09_17605 [Devosia sp.]|nr:hypothetical protein [Devosia sp.]